MQKRGNWTKAWTLVLALVFAFFVAGCSDDDDSVSTDQPLSKAQGTGTVTGLVVDTNGNPLSGVQVYLLDMTTTTNAGGIYTFKKVPVASVLGADQQTLIDSDECGACQGVRLTVAAPSGYLGASVVAYPYAQFDGSNDYTGDAGVISEGNNKVVTFVDGFVAQAKTAVLPQLGATVSGTLRDCETGKAIANQQVNLDLDYVNCTGEGTCVDGDDIFYATPNYVAFTNSEGKFSFANLPFDSHFDLLSPSYEEDASENDFGSTDDEDYDDILESVETEDVNNELGSVLACLVRDAGDQIHPQVKKVNGVFTVMEEMEDTCIDCQDESESVEIGFLSEGINQTFEIVFSECLMDMAAFDVIARDCTGDEYLAVDSAVLDAEGLVLTVTLAEPVDPGHEIIFFLEKDDFKDLASNNIVDEQTGEFNYIDYDCDRDANWAEYLAINLHIFKEANVDPDQVTETGQMGDDCKTAGDPDLFDTDDHPDLYNYSSAFNDVVDDSGVVSHSGVSQLNADEAEVRLQDLGEAILGGVWTDVETNFARVRFVATNASSYEVTTTGISSCEVVGKGSCAFDFTAANGSTIQVEVSGADPGDKVTIIPKDDFGFSGTPTTVTLVDNVVPTTALQNAYGVACATDMLVVPGDPGEPAYGDGAELAGLGEAAAPGGTPLFNVTPFLLADQSLANGIVPTRRIIFNLYALNVANPDDDEPAFDNQFTDSDEIWWNADGINNNSGDEDGVYDATAFAAWTGAGISRVVGVAFTENISLIDAAAFGYDGSVVLSNLAANNNVVTQDDGQTPVVQDLVNVEVAEVVDLANIDHGSTMDFTNVVADAAGNVAGDCANAKVVVTDKMPPFMTRAYLTEEGLTMEFNEDVVIADPSTDFITLIDPNQVLADANISLDLATQPDERTIFIPIEELDTDAPDSPGAYFSDLHSYPEAIYADVTTETDLDHGIIRYDLIEDELGNSWSDYNGVLFHNNVDGEECGTGPENEVLTPVFAGIDAIGEFDIVIQRTAPALVEGVSLPSGTTLQVFYTWNHPIDIPVTFNSLATTRDDVNTLMAATTDPTGYVRFHTDFDDLDIVEDCGGETTYTGFLSADLKSFTFTYTNVCNSDPMSLGEFLGYRGPASAVYNSVLSSSGTFAIHSSLTGEATALPNQFVGTP